MIVFFLKILKIFYFFFVELKLDSLKMIKDNMGCYEIRDLINGFINRKVFKLKLFE